MRGATTNGERLFALDVVRGIAILLVLLFHFQPAPGSPLLDILASPFERAGWAGVDLFFVLSGFLVGRMILNEAATTGGFSYSRFLWRRAWRLWPALFAYLALLGVAGGAHGWQTIWPVLLHVQNYHETTPSHLWSLAVEEHFYLGAALLLPLLLRRGPSHLLFGLVAIASLSFALRLLAFAAGVPPLSLQWQTQFRLEGLAIGVAIAACSLYRPHWIAAAGRHRAALLALALSCFSAIAIGDSEPFRHTIGFTIAAFGSGALVLAMLDARMPRWADAPARAFAALGAIAYSLYIWHASLGQTAEALAPSLGLTHPAAIIVFQLAAAIGLSAALYGLIERPALGFRDRKQNEKPAKSSFIATNSQVQRFP
jgi:peptidoglycan/LPS O-acetylase OafA/YrhL